MAGASLQQPPACRKSRKTAVFLAVRDDANTILIDIRRAATRLRLTKKAHDIELLIKHRSEERAAVD
jgi:hypothetical protein